MHNVARPISLRSGYVAYVDAGLLPEDLVEELAARGALVLSKATGPEAVIHLDAEGYVARVERQGEVMAPVREDAVVVDLETYRLARVRAKVRGALAGAVTMLPFVLTLPPVVHL
jgi:hypothetical protein